ncbi:hypothetical protein [Yinghuangia sp. YIM S09857]|uniref:hypothetical protein n=1 Tax=Yinghuangia sp. YIM S09857 TaxID=3436929 RepID=UPI003F53DF50
MTNPTMTLTQWCRIWVNTERATWPALARRITPVHLRTRILPDLGPLLLTEITPDLLAQHVVERLAVHREVRPGDLLPTLSVAAEMRLLRRVLDAAVDAGHLETTPAIAVYVPDRAPAAGGAE